MTLTVGSLTVVNNEDCSDSSADGCPLFPQDNTTFGANTSPTFSWTAGPSPTQSYALVLNELSTGFVYWALYDIPAETLSLPASLPKGTTLTTPVMAEQASLGSGRYYGASRCNNVYEFRLYAVPSATLNVVSGLATPANVRDALNARSIESQAFVRLESRDYCLPGHG